MSTRITIRRAAAMLVAVGVWIGCTEDPVGPAPLVTGPALAVGEVAPAPPAGLFEVAFGGASIHVWPYTGNDLAGTAADPVNLLFTGHVDVLSLRAALLQLDGDRTAFGLPNTFPFNCRWTDANGSVQTVYTDGDGWVANPVQLECGAYSPLRFHLRLFPAGNWVVGAVHFDLLIPGTPDHQVISWELARQMVLVDFLRSGRLDGVMPMGETPVMSSAPAFRDIPAVIYDGMPAELKFAIGGPPSSGGEAVPLASSGTATILNIAQPADVADGQTASDLVLPFDQVIPRPFCLLGPNDVVQVSGQIRVTTLVEILDGKLTSHNTLGGDLVVTPLDIQTGGPSGEPFMARVDYRYQTGVGPTGASVNVLERILAIPPAADGHGSLETHLNTGPNGAAHYTTRERC